MGLEEIRVGIDEIDSKMCELFQKRMQLSKQVARTKIKEGGDVFRPEREEAMLKERLTQVDWECKDFYPVFLRQVVGTSRSYQYGQMLLGKEYKREWKELLEKVPKTDTFQISFVCDKDNMAIYSCMLAFESADWNILEINAKRTEHSMNYVLTLEGKTMKLQDQICLIQLLEEMNHVAILDGFC